MPEPKQAEQAEFDLGETPIVEEVVEPEIEQESAPDPAAALQSQLEVEREQRIRLEERLAAKNEQPAPTPKEEPKIFTRQQLRAAVNEGTIDEDQMEEVWSTQQRELTKRETAKLLDDRETVRNAVNFVEDETSKYIAAFPDVKNQGSDTWKRVKSAYDYMRKLGDPDNKATELKALRAALGTPERIRESTARRRETSGETSGGSSAGGDRPVDIFNRIPPKYRTYYKKRYDEGYITVEDIKKDLPYMDRTT